MPDAFDDIPGAKPSPESASAQDRSAAAAEGTAREPRPTTGLRRFLLLIVLPLVAIAAGVYWYAVTGRYVETENAYVKTRIIAISPDIDGRVISVSVDENQVVKAGEVLFRIDPAPYRVALDLGAAKMQAVRNQIEGLRAEYRRIRAEIDQVREKVKYYETKLQRQRELSRRGISPQAKLDEAEFNLVSARQTIRVLEQEINKVLTGIGGDPNQRAEDNPLFLQVKAERDLARIKLGQTTITAPADGIVTRMNLEPGEWLEEGKSAFGLIATGEVWIEANLKETELTHVVEGQTVRVTVDAYPDSTWRAVVASISPATGAEFTVLPPQNASGNWVKVVQRLPVRIAILPAPGNPPLRAGMTATVEIDTHRERPLLTLARQRLAELLDLGRRLDPVNEGLAGGAD